MDLKKLLSIFEADSGATGASAMASRAKSAPTKADTDDAILNWQGSQPVKVPGGDTPAGAMAEPDVYKSASGAQQATTTRTGTPKGSYSSFAKPAPAQTAPKSPTAMPKAGSTGSAVSGTGQAIKTGSGGTLRTRSAAEFGNSPQDYYRRMMRPGQNEDIETIEEKAVSQQQQKFMGMVHAMQKGKKIKGASPELKKVAKTMGKKDAKDFASTKHKGLPKKVTEDIMLDEGGQALKHIANRFKHEVKNFMNSGFMDDDLYEALYDYYADAGEMPYGVAKARTGDPHQWVEERFYQDMGSGMSEDTGGALNELARLAGLSESRVDECGDMGMEQEGGLNVSTNMSSDGKKNVTISAQGEEAEALMQMLKLAGMGTDHIGHNEPEMVIVGSDNEELEEEFANEPEEEYQTIASITHQGNDLNREKKQFAGKPRLGDNPMAEEFELDEEMSNLLDSVLIRREDEMDEGVLDTVGSAISKAGTAVSNFVGDTLGTEASALRNNPQLQQIDANRKAAAGTPQQAEWQKKYNDALIKYQTGGGMYTDYDQKTGKTSIRQYPPIKSPAAPAAPSAPAPTPKRWAGDPSDVQQLEKGGIKGATMAPPDSKYPPGDKRNLIKP